MVTDASVGTAIELGMQFTSDTGGYITAVRFYKGAGNTGSHVGSLWASTGELLARVTFTGETASGWQQATFATPVAIAANTVYVISYHSNGGYSYDPRFFNSAVDNAPLHALTAARGNGVYVFGATSSFPGTSASGTNFWVDVVFATP
jgi:Domain of unknown function (DUF4082)